MCFSESRHLRIGAKPDPGWFFLGLQFGVSGNPSWELGEVGSSQGIGTSQLWCRWAWTLLTGGGLGIPWSLMEESPTSVGWEHGWGQFADFTEKILSGCVPATPLPSLGSGRVDFGFHCFLPGQLLPSPPLPWVGAFSAGCEW